MIAEIVVISAQKGFAMVLKRGFVFHFHSNGVLLRARGLHLFVSLVAIRAWTVPIAAALIYFYDVIAVTVMLEPELPLAINAVGAPLKTWTPLALQREQEVE